MQDSKQNVICSNKESIPMAGKYNTRKHIVRSTSSQINFLVNYMVSNKDFANGLGVYSGVLGTHKTNEEWDSLRMLLNEYGADKSVMQWKHTWRDLKRKARKLMKGSEPQLPVVSDTIFKILETMGQTCAVEFESDDVAPEDDITLDEWEVDSEHSMPDENITKCIKNSPDHDSNSVSSLQTECDDESIQDVKNLTVSHTPASEEIKLVTFKQLQRDALQASVVGTPRRVARLVPPPSRTPRPHSTTSLHRRRSSMARRRKPPLTTLDFFTLEQQRLRMDEERDRRLHEREMERLKLELQRVEVQRNHNEIMQHLVGIAQKVYELLNNKFN